MFAESTAAEVFSLLCKNSTISAFAIDDSSSLERKGIELEVPLVRAEPQSILNQRPPVCDRNKSRQPIGNILRQKDNFLSVAFLSFSDCFFRPWKGLLHAESGNLIETFEVVFKWAPNSLITLRMEN